MSCVLDFIEEINGFKKQGEADQTCNNQDNCDHISKFNLLKYFIPLPATGENSFSHHRSGHSFSAQLKVEPGLTVQDDAGGIPA